MYTFNNSLVFRVKFTVTLFPSTKLSIPNAKGRDMFLLFSLFLHFFFFKNYHALEDSGDSVWKLPKYWKNKENYYQDIHLHDIKQHGKGNLRQKAAVWHATNSQAQAASGNIEFLPS